MHSRLRAAASFVVFALAADPLGAAAAAAQPTAPAAPPASAAAATPGILDGTIVDQTGAPVAGAVVSATAATGNSSFATVSASSAADGSFTLNLPPGSYTLSARKAGFDVANLSDYAVAAGANQRVSVSLVPITFSSLRTIGRVSASSSRSAFNTSAASIATISNQQFFDQGAVQVGQLLDQTPGVVVDHPGTSANNAAPGAITFPSVRGGLGFETASLIDGHPLAVQTFGDYVTTFLTPFVLQDVEVVKGPGATAPETYYAINGTVNFRTLDPTRNLVARVDEGLDSYGGEFSNYRISDTVLHGKLGFVFDAALDGTPGPLKDSQGYGVLPSTYAIAGKAVGTTTSATPNPANVNNPFSTSTLLACCYTVNTQYNNRNELAKLQYHFSDATVATVSYLGSQTYTDQNGNHVYGLGEHFKPGAAYRGAIPAGSVVETYQNVFPLGYFEINNEPIFQGEIRTTVGRDTALARYYAASINRLQYQADGNPNASLTIPFKLYGTAGGNTYNGQSANVTVPPGGAYFESSEEDKLHGGSLEYDHFLGTGGNYLAFSFDQTNANTDSYSLQGVPPSAAGAAVPPTARFSIYGGSNVRYTTYRLTGNFNLTQKLNFLYSNYYDNYSQRYTIDGGKTFEQSTYGRYDGRGGFTYRADPNVSLRISAGSSLAPPYLALLDSGAPAYTIDASGTFARDTQNQGTVRAETSFGYDGGLDVRFGDKQNVFSTDVYLNNVYNQFVSGSVAANGTITLCPNSSAPPPCSAGVVPKAYPLFTSTAANLTNARYQGFEASFRRDPRVGFGYVAQGDIMRAFPYNVSPCLYSSVVLANGQKNCAAQTTNLAIVPGINYQSSGSGGLNGNVANGAGNSFNSVNNHAIPYSQGYAEIHYRSARNDYLSFGVQYLGPNNSYNLPGFFIANATTRLALAKQFYAQASVYNLLGAYQNPFIQPAAGIAAPLVNGQDGLTNANTVGPRVVRFTLTKQVGGTGLAY